MQIGFQRVLGRGHNVFEVDDVQARVIRKRSLAAHDFVRQFHPLGKAQIARCTVDVGQAQYAALLAAQHGLLSLVVVTSRRLVEVLHRGVFGNRLFARAAVAVHRKAGQEHHTRVRGDGALATGYQRIVIRRLALLAVARLAHIGGHGGHDCIATLGNLGNLVGISAASHVNLVSEFTQRFDLGRRGGGADNLDAVGTQARSQRFADVAQSQNQDFLHV